MENIKRQCRDYKAKAQMAAAIHQRTADCVNALAGVPDPAALMDAVREVIKADKALLASAASRLSARSRGTLPVPDEAFKFDAAIRRLEEVMGHE